MSREIEIQDDPDQSHFRHYTTTSSGQLISIHTLFNVSKLKLSFKVVNIKADASWCPLVDISTTYNQKPSGQRSYLSGITHKVSALITPNPLCCHHKHQHAENKHHGQPNPPEGSGVFIDSTQQRLQPRPVHPCCCCTGLGEVHPHDRGRQKRRLSCCIITTK